MQSTDDRPALSAGDIILGNYRLSHRLAASSRGAVWEAYDSLSRHPVTLRIVGPEANSTLRDRFAQSALALRSVSSPGIVQYLEFAHHEPWAIAISPKPADARLADLIAAGQRPTAADVRLLALGVLDALVEAHARGIVHGAVGPNSINVEVEAGQVAWRSTTLEGFGFSGDRAHRYRPPESKSGAQPGPGDDLYGLGVALLECLGAKPGRNFNLETALKQSQGSRLRPPGALITALGRLAAQAQGRRFPNAASARRAFGEAFDRWPQTQTPAPVVTAVAAESSDVRISEPPPRPSLASVDRRQRPPVESVQSPPPVDLEAPPQPKPSGVPLALTELPAVSAIEPAQADAPVAQRASAPPIAPPKPSTAEDQAPATAPSAPIAPIPSSKPSMPVAAIVTPREAQRITLDLDGEPRGATVSLDAVVRGHLPLKLSDVAPGEHLVQLSAAGHLPQSFELALSGDTAITVQLIAAQPVSIEAGGAPATPLGPEPTPAESTAGEMRFAGPSVIDWVARTAVVIGGLGILAVGLASGNPALQMIGLTAAIGGIGWLLTA